MTLWCPICDRSALAIEPNHLVRCLYEYADVYVGGQGFYSEQSIVDRRARDATRSVIAGEVS